MQTPRETFAHARAITQRDLAHAWCTAAFTRATQLPRLRDVLDRSGRDENMAEQSPEEQMMLVRLWGYVAEAHADRDKH